MTDLVHNEETVLKNNLELTTQILDGIILDNTENEESLIELNEAENELREKIRKLQEKISEKRTRRAELRNAERLAKREKDAAEVKFKQFQAEKSKDADKLENFKRMTDFAHSKSFAWVDMAYPHQWQGALQLAHYGNALLADTMGLGKTLQSIMYLDMLDCGHEELGAKKVLMIVPNDVVSAFVDELKKYAPHRRNIIPLTGATATTRGYAKMAVENLDDYVIVSNYNAVRNNDMAILADYELDAIIIDEAHNINDISGATFESVRALKSKNYLPITATFILNRPQDLFASLNLVLPKIFDREDKFLSAYCIQGYENKWTFKPGGEKALMNNLGGRIVKRNYSEAGIVLPEMVRNDIYIPMEELSEEQFDVYQQITKYSEVAISDEQTAGIESVIALITRQRQALCYPAGISIKVTQKMYDTMTEMGIGCEPPGTVLLQIPETVPSKKIDVATERIIKATKNGHRTVVFSQFKTALKGLEESLVAQGIKVARFDGDTKKDMRNKIKDDFKRKPQGTPYEYDVVLCNYKTGGVGLTLTAATYMLKLDVEWNPGKNDQAEARIHRIGQTERVLVETLYVENGKSNDSLPSIDQWMKELVEIKSSMIGGFENELMESNIRDSYRNFLAAPSEPKQVEKKPVKKVDMDLDLYDF